LILLSSSSPRGFSFIGNDLRCSDCSAWSLLWTSSGRLTHSLQPFLHLDAEPRQDALHDHGMNRGLPLVVPQGKRPPAPAVQDDLAPFSWPYLAAQPGLEQPEQLVGPDGADPAVPLRACKI
jgi:hypothetical protein